MRIGPIGIINRAFPSMFSRTSGVPGKRGCLVLPDFPDQVTFQNFPEKHLEETGATSAPWETFGGRGLREPTEPVSVADSLGPAPHREFEEGTALALMDPVLVCSGCPVSLPTRVTTFIVWCPMWEMVVCGGEGLHFVPAAVGSGGPGMGSLAAYKMKSRMALTWRGSHFWQYPVAACKEEMWLLRISSTLDARGPSRCPLGRMRAAECGNLSVDSR